MRERSMYSPTHCELRAPRPSSIRWMKLEWVRVVSLHYGSFMSARTPHLDDVPRRNDNTRACNKFSTGSAAADLEGLQCNRQTEILSKVVDKRVERVLDALIPLEDDGHARPDGRSEPRDKDGGADGSGSVSRGTEGKEGGTAIDTLSPK